MPQATDELRKQMAEYFPDFRGEPNAEGIWDAPVYHFLVTNGLKEEKGKFTIPKEYMVNAKILNCLHFMCDEWDYDYHWEGVVR